MDESAADPRADRKPLASRPAPAAVQPRSWPVLARIADVARSETTLQLRIPQSAKPAYRVDAPHVYAPNLSPPLARPPAKPPHRPGTQRPATSHTSESDTAGDAAKVRLPESVPLPIRITVDAWRLVHPHRELIQFTAMVVLMVVGGMSMVLLMGDRLQPVETSPAPSTPAPPLPPPPTTRSLPKPALSRSTSITRSRPQPSPTPTRHPPRQPRRGPWCRNRGP